MSKMLLLKPLRVTKLYYNDPPVVPLTVPPTVPPVSPPPPPPTQGKTFTEEQVAAMMENHRKGLQTENKDLITQLETLRNNVNLTSAEKEALQARIDTLSQQHLTKEQQTQSEVEKWKKKYESDTKSLIEKETVWKSRFENMLIENAISTGAVQHKARNATQLQMMLKNGAKVVEEVDDAGKPTGNWVAKMAVEVLDTKTKQKMKVELPIVEAIGKLREDDQFSNLFDVDGRSGIGGSNHGNGTGGAGGIPNFAKMGPAEHAAWRKANPG